MNRLPFALAALLLLLSPAAAQQKKRKRLALTELQVLSKDDKEQELGKSLTDFISSKLDFKRYLVLDRTEIERILREARFTMKQLQQRQPAVVSALERQVDLLLVGTLSRVGGMRHQLTLKLVSMTDGSLVDSQTGQVGLYPSSGLQELAVKLLDRMGLRSFREAHEHELPAAVTRGDLSLVEKLLAAGVGAGSTVTGSNRFRRIPILHVAARHGRVKIAELLIRRGAQVDARSSNTLRSVKSARLTALHIAVESRQLEMVKLLLEKGADINAPIEDGIYRKGMTALHLAVRQSHAKLVELLLARGATPDVVAAGLTPLILAIEKRQPSLALLLAARSSKLDYTNYGMTALDHAVAAGYLDLVKRLLARGARIGGGTLLRARSLEIARCLVESGASVRALTSPGVLLHQAVKDKNLALVRFWLEQGLDASARDKLGWTPLHQAAIDGALEIAKALLAGGASVNAGWGEQGQTPLDEARKKGHRAMVLLLTEHGGRSSK